MKIANYLAISCSLLFIPFGQASVSITLPQTTNPLLLNGQVVEKQQLQNDNGLQQLVFKYTDGYRQFGTQKRFTSEAIIVTFSATDNEYQIKLPEINSDKAAQKFNQNPQLEIIDSKGQKVEYKVDTLTKEGMQVGRNYQEEIQIYNISGGSAAINLPSNQAIVPITPLLPVITPQEAQQIAVAPTSTTTNTTAPNSSQINVGQMLDFWYQQADEATKEAFKKRIQDK